MKLTDFLKDKWLSLAVHLAVMAFTGIFLNVQGISDYGISFLLGLYLLGLLAALCYEYFRRRLYYGNVRQALSQLDKKFLLPDMLDPAPFAEGEILRQVVCETGKAMNDEIAGYRRVASEYRDYVEMWIHEVKTPIASSRLIIENNRSPVTQSIGEEIEKVDYYLEQALFYARSSGLEKDYLIRRVSLRELCNTVIRRNAKLFVQHKVELVTEGLDRTVYTDSKWMEYVLMQLVVNALKYRGDCPVVRLRAEEEKSRVLLFVEDNGIGISERDLPRVFDKGYTGQIGRRYAKSTGMGLYLCRQLCEKMGLSIRIQSKEGQGTAVCVVFPKSNMHRTEEDTLTKS